jgi:single-strand DNA-binding protein
MANYNKVILAGNLTRDPEKRFTPNGASVTEFGLAVNRVFRTQSGDKREETCFVDIVAWGRTGELCEQYLRKGRPVLLDGRLEYSSWEGQDGRKRSKLRVVADVVQFLGGPGDGGGRGGGDYGESRSEPRRAQERPAQQPQQPQRPPEQARDPGPAEDDYNLDDIPF